MNFLLTLPAIVSFLLLAAHFLRWGNHVLVAVCLLAPLLLITRRLVLVRVVQFLLLLGSLEWIRTIIVNIDARAEAGEPWVRMAIILGGVWLWTVVSAFLLFLFRPRARLVRGEESG